MAGCELNVQAVPFSVSLLISKVKNVWVRFRFFSMKIKSENKENGCWNGKMLDVLCVGGVYDPSWTENMLHWRLAHVDFRDCNRLNGVLTEFGTSTEATWSIVHAVCARHTRNAILLPSDHRLNWIHFVAREKINKIRQTHKRHHHGAPQQSTGWLTFLWNLTLTSSHTQSHTHDLDEIFREDISLQHETHSNTACWSCEKFIG